MDASVEQTILERSHSPETARRILREKLSITGEKKPYVILGSTAVATGTSPNAATVATNSSIKNRYGGSMLAKTEPRIGAPRWAMRRLISQIRQGKQSIAYQQFESLNNLWQKYMQELLFQGNETSGLKSARSEQTLLLVQKLTSADFHGAEVCVTRARNPSLVGQQGIVVWDSKNSLVVAVRNDPKTFKVLQKPGTHFGFNIKAGSKIYQFEMIGSRFCYRAADRAGRKFKNKKVDDL